MTAPRGEFRPAKPSHNLPARFVEFGEDGRVVNVTYFKIQEVPAAIGGFVDLVIIEDKDFRPEGSEHP